MQMCEKAGVPAGAVNVVPCSRERVQEVGALLCDSPRIQVLSFTGSTLVGKVRQTDHWVCSPVQKQVETVLI